MKELSKTERDWLKKVCKQDVDSATLYHLYDGRDHYERYALCVSWNGDNGRVCKYLHIKEGNYFTVRKNLVNADYRDIDLRDYNPLKDRSGLYIKEDYIVMRWL